MPFSIQRRKFMIGTAAVGAAAVGAAASIPTFAKNSKATASSPGTTQPPRTVQHSNVKLEVNGASHTLTVDNRTSLLDLLRETLGLTGTKKGCDHGQCGACTVLVNGQRINSCLSLAVQNQGKQITTIEGLAKGDELHPMQKAFVEHDAFQCGFCTPGQILSAVALLKEPCGKSEADIRECMSGNICRCGAYRNIVAAIQDVREKHGGDHAAL